MKTRRILNPLAIAAEGAALLPVEQRERREARLRWIDDMIDYWESKGE